MEDTALRKALAMLRSFTDNLPKSSDIEEKYVLMYHNLLTELGQQTGHDFAYFQVPASEVRRIVVSSSFGVDGPGKQNYSDDRYCDRPIFLMKLQGTLNFLASFLPDSPAKRIIGFTQPE